MYRVIVKDSGRYGNVTPGAWYCFRKKSVALLIALFTECDCDFTVEQFIRIHGDTFYRSDSVISEKIWNMVNNILDKSKQK